MKKRELLPKLHKIIAAFTNLSGDIATLELIDNDAASLRIWRALVDIPNDEIQDLKNEITNIRYDFNEKKWKKKGRKPKRPKKPTKNQ